MAKEYIEREDALVIMEAQRKRIKKQIDEALACEHFHTRSDLKCALSQLEDDMYLIENIQAADVRPVVHARWVHGAHGPYCSNCDAYPPLSWRTNMTNETQFDYSRFCPTCGADMREVQDG